MRRLAVPLVLVLLIVGVTGCIRSLRMQPDDGQGAPPCNVFGSMNDEPPDWPTGWVAYSIKWDNCEGYADSPYYFKNACAYIRSAVNHIIVSETCTDPNWEDWPDDISRGWGSTVMHCDPGEEYYFQINFFWKHKQVDEMFMRWKGGEAWTCPGWQ